MWILLDNYDSFTHILHHYLLLTGNECKVIRNDEVTVDELAALNPSRLIISPGPETPLQAGICMDAIAHFHNRIPILGVCLGHQALGMFFGAKLVRAPYPMHGKVSEVAHDNSALFAGAPNPFNAMRYHSLILEALEDTGLLATAHTTGDNTIAALQHETLPLTGIQFHPESVGTEHGQLLLNNWAKLYSEQ